MVIDYREGGGLHNGEITHLKHITHYSYNYTFSYITNYPSPLYVKLIINIKKLMTCPLGHNRQGVA